MLFAHEALGTIFAPPGPRGYLRHFPVRRSIVLVIALAGFAVQSWADDVQVPDYFSSTRDHVESANRAGNSQELTQDEAENVIERADYALQKLAGGDPSIAYAFVSIFGATVDYYDEGKRTPSQIASEKQAIFRNYRTYSTELIGRIALNNSDSPNVKWASFTYRYEIEKKSGGILRGVADAKWALEKVDGKVLVVATRETTRRQ
jgi:hypothetical protein